MARKKSSKLERSKVPAEVQENVNQMEEHEGRLDDISSDVEVVAETLGAIEGGTCEGQEAEQQAIESAREIGVDHFKEKKGEIAQVHEEAETLETEMDEGRELAQSDVDMIKEADSKLQADIARDKLSEAASEAQSDIDLLNTYTDCSRQERQESQKLLEEYSQRVEKAQGA
ncbi:MAG: hypothetical protein GY869_09600 [Planctomycetes bacterium]|nr:hypothetical protein [Planctomycetota bacterium]